METKIELKPIKPISEMTIDEFFEYMFNKKYQEFIKQKQNEPYIQIHDPNC